MSDKAVLTTEDLTIGYSGSRSRDPIVVASGLNLELRDGMVTALLGANGVGKSTLLRTLSRQQELLAGGVRIFERDMRKLSAGEVARAISVVHTERTNAGALTVREVVGIGRQPYTGFFGRLNSDDRLIVDEALEAVGISAIAGRYMANISDGQRQKTMIARALAQQTPVMILDEPTSFLDVAARLETVGFLSSLARDFNKAILLSMHDIADALTVADRLWLFRPDRTIVDGPKDELVDSGLMDSLFPDSPIQFDHKILDYRLTR